MAAAGISQCRCANLVLDLGAGRDVEGDRWQLNHRVTEIAQTPEELAALFDRDSEANRAVIRAAKIALS